MSANKVFALFGPPKIMQSDNGTEFNNKLVKRLTQAAGVDHKQVAPYNPRANGLAERTVQTVKTILKKKLEGTWDRWEQALPGVTMAINCKEASLTKAAPFTLFFGRSANAWQDYATIELALTFGAEEQQQMERMHRQMEKEVRPAVQDAADKRQATANAKLNAKRKIVAVDFPVGAQVMRRDPVRTTKLDPVWAGPYTVVRKTSGQTYELRDQRGQLMPRAFPVSQLKYVADTPVRLMSGQGEPVPAGGEQFEVEQILNHREVQSVGGLTNYQYLVRWTGYGAADDEWLDPGAFHDTAAMTAYWKQQGRSRKRARQAGKQPAQQKNKNKRKNTLPPATRRSKRVKPASTKR